MTFVGKILTVLILVMSLVFGAMTIMVIASNKNWKIEAEKQAADKEVLLTKLNTTDKEKIELERRIKKETAARASVVAALTAETIKYAEDLNAKNKENSALEKENTSAHDQLEVTTKQNADLVDQVGKLQAAIKQTRQERDNTLLDAIATAAANATLEGKHRILTERKDQLVKQVVKAKTALDANGIDPNQPTDGRVPPGTQAVVTAVSSKNPDFIEISIGSDDGLRKEHQLTVVRGNKYLGRFVVLETKANSAIGKVENRKGIIKKNDIVTNKLQ